MIVGGIPLRRGVLDITLYDKVCQWLVAGRLFSPGTPVSFTNKIDRHDITEILLKMALNTINLTPNPIVGFVYLFFIWQGVLFLQFVVVNQEYKAIDELEKLKAEIGPYKG